MDKPPGKAPLRYRNMDANRTAHADKVEQHTFPADYACDISDGKRGPAAGWLENSSSHGE